MEKSYQGYSVIGLLWGQVEQFEREEEVSALLQAKDLVARGAVLVEIYDADDVCVWHS